MRPLHWLILGGTRGLGSAIADHAAGRGDQVTLVARHPVPHSKHDFPHAFVRCDVSREQDRNKLAQVLAQGDAIDRVIFSIAYVDNHNSTPDVAQLKASVEINAWAYYDLVVQLNKAKLFDSERKAIVAAVGSRSAYSCNGQAPGYSMAKWLLHRSPEILARSLSPSIKPVVLVPPRMRTRLHNFDADLLYPSIVAPVIYDLLRVWSEVDESVVDVTAVMNRSAAPIDDGSSRHILYKHGENPLGLSPRARMAVRAIGFRQDLHLYPDSDSLRLQHCLAEHHALNDENILVTSGGSSALIRDLVWEASSQHVEWLVPTPSFQMVRQWCQQHSAPFHSLELKPTPVYVPAQYDVDHLLTSTGDAGTEMILYIVNPSSPFAYYLSTTNAKRLIQSLPTDCLTILDEAYMDWVPEHFTRRGDVFELWRHPSIYRNNKIIALRTFSKALSLGGLRIGYAYGSRTVIGRLRRLALPFSLPRTTTGAAIEAVRDREHLLQSRAFVHREKTRFSKLSSGVTSKFTWNNSLLLHRNHGWSMEEVRSMREIGFWPRLVEANPTHLHVYISNAESNSRLMTYLTNEPS